MSNDSKPTKGELHGDKTGQDELSGDQLDAVSGGTPASFAYVLLGHLPGQLLGSPLGPSSSQEPTC
jgi:hypothetical protein